MHQSLPDHLIGWDYRSMMLQKQCSLQPFACQQTRALVQAWRCLDRSRRSLWTSRTCTCPRRTGQRTRRSSREVQLCSCILWTAANGLVHGCLLQHGTPSFPDCGSGTQRRDPGARCEFREPALSCQSAPCAGYDATSHFETTVEDVLDMYQRITGKPLDLSQTQDVSQANTDV